MLNCVVYVQAVRGELGITTLFMIENYRNSQTSCCCIAIYADIRFQLETIIVKLNSARIKKWLLHEQNQINSYFGYMLCQNEKLQNSKRNTLLKYLKILAQFYHVNNCSYSIFFLKVLVPSFCNWVDPTVRISNFISYFLHATYKTNWSFPKNGDLLSRLACECRGIEFFHVVSFYISLYI